MTVDAKEILRQSAETIGASFWMRGDEISFVDEDEGESVDKWLDVVVGKSWGPTWQGEEKKVTAVCSIGAMALAVTLLDKQKPLEEYDHYITSDFEMLKASLALIHSVYTPDELIESGVDNPGEAIADWNDNPNTSKDDVIEGFRKAMESPILGLTEIWALCYEYSGSPIKFPGVFFATEDKARLALADFRAYYESYDEEKDDFDLDGSKLAVQLSEDGFEPDGLGVKKVGGVLVAT